MTSRNEAAERLLSEWVASGELPTPPRGGWTLPRLVDYLEAGARRATVERLRKALHLDDYDPDVSEIPGRGERIFAAVVVRALNEEAARG